MEWHISRYVLFTQLPNSNFVVGFNLLKNNIFILSLQEVELLYNFNKLNENNDNLKKFKEKGILINYDEIEYYKYLIKNTPNGNVLSLTICPTINCNFDCPYCFEKHIPSNMSVETQNLIIDFIKKILNNNKNIEKIKVTWYGGEPLLGIDVIQNLSKKIIQLCNDNNINYNASIITNGYLLSQDKADLLNKYNVRHYQITLDGLNEVHNKTRRLKNGGPTFETIIENLRKVKINGNISIRYNTHKDNLKDFSLIKKLIKNISIQSGNNISVYSAIIIGNAAEEREGQVNLLSEKEGSALRIERDCKKNPKFRSRFCGAQSLYSLTIDPFGNLYKCWEDVDKIERSFGHIEKWDINNPILSSNNPEILLKYLNSFNVLDDDECKNCVLLPICCGSCPSKRFFFKKHCFEYKNYIDDYLKRIAERYVKEHSTKLVDI